MSFNPCCGGSGTEGAVIFLSPLLLIGVSILVAADRGLKVRIDAVRSRSQLQFQSLLRRIGD